MNAVQAIAAVRSHWQTPERHARRRRPAREQGSEAAADPQADQEHGQDQRKRVDGPAENER